MRAIDVVKSPLHLAELATGAKSFIDNPIIGSPRLNEMGLHVARIRLAERMADFRRRSLERLVSQEDVAAYARDGIVVKRNFLPEDAFRRLSEEVENRTFEAHEMKGGDTVTRFIALPPRVLAGTPELAALVNGGALQGLLRYVASTSGDPLIYLHAVITDPGKGAKDPQTAFHSDTFHPTAKCWFFLRDVEIEDGPFTYVPGSHRLTPAGWNGSGASRSTPGRARTASTPAARSAPQRTSCARWATATRSLCPSPRTRWSWRTRTAFTRAPSRPGPRCGSGSTARSGAIRSCPGPAATR